MPAVSLIKFFFIPSRVERNHVSVVHRLLAESVRQPREPTHRHPHGQVLALDITGAGVHGVWTTLYAAEINADAFTGAVAA